MNDHRDQILAAITDWNFTDEHCPKSVQEVLATSLATIEENNRLRSELEITTDLLDNVCSTARKQLTKLRRALRVILPYAAQSDVSGIDSAIKECKQALGED